MLYLNNAGFSRHFKQYTPSIKYFPDKGYISYQLFLCLEIIFVYMCYSGFLK